MSRVTSKDGTSIAYDRKGRGPAVILVGGGLDDGSENAPLAPELAERFTVYNYGRGASGDTPPYALERELEDIEALIAEAGGSAHLYGVSSGGALALEAAAAGSAVDKLAVYEVPFFVAEEALQRWREYVEQLGAALAQGRRGAAVELFMRVAGASEEMIVGARSSPVWPGLEALAHNAKERTMTGTVASQEEPQARQTPAGSPAVAGTGRAGSHPVHAPPRRHRGERRPAADQHDLGFSRPGLAWVVNSYVLMAGGLLLLGGRLADLFGRRRLFLLGVGIFALPADPVHQQVLGYSPLEGGLADLPFGVAIGAGIGLATALMPRLGVKPLLVVGFFGGAVGCC
jgi:hypothetical protein